MRERPVFGLLPLVFCAGAAVGLGACRAEQTQGRSLDLDSTDGYTVRATLHSPETAGTPGIILLHMAGSTRAAWQSFQELARADGYFSIAIDLRGHGETRSSQAGGDSPSAFTAGNWLGILDDVAAAKRVLIEAGADPQRIAIAGASIGANLALRYAEDDPAIGAVVMVSPGEDYRGVATLRTMETFTGRPLLMMAARGDAYSAQSAQKLDALAKEFCELRLYPGAAHGTDLLSAEPVASDQILMWLDQIFGRSAGGPR